MQDFEVYVQGWGNWNEQIDALVANRQAPLPMIQWFSHNALRQDVALLPWEDVEGEETRLILRASCGGPRCWRVVAVNTLRVRMHEGVDCLKCPCHEVACRTYSPLCATFLQSITPWYSGPVVWDWADISDVPNGTHFDATIAFDNRAVRFEIDGKYHIVSPRIESDRFKDIIVNQNGQSMLRLHYGDKHRWNALAWEYSVLHRVGVYYTASYHHVACALIHPGRILG